MIKVEVTYHALLREQAGCTTESVRTQARTLAGLYEECAQRHQLTLKPEHMKVARNDRFADWSTAVVDEDRIGFIPPVAGG